MSNPERLKELRGLIVQFTKAAAQSWNALNPTEKLDTLGLFQAFQDVQDTDRSGDISVITPHEEVDTAYLDRIANWLLDNDGKNADHVAEAIIEDHQKKSPLTDESITHRIEDYTSRIEILSGEEKDKRCFQIASFLRNAHRAFPSPGSKFS